MNFEYTLNLELPLDEAWATLMDVEQIAPCMPGAKIESHDGDQYTGRLKVKLGPMEMTYRGDIHFIERDDAAKHAVVDAQAKEIKGRGEAKTRVTMNGTASGSGSKITLVSEFSVSGKAAQFGRGVMEEVGEKLMDDFAQRLGAQIGAQAPAASVMDAEPERAASGSEVVPEAAPAATRMAEPPAATPPEEEAALDIGNAALRPLLRRFAIPGVIIIAVIAVYALL